MEINELPVKFYSRINSIQHKYFLSVQCQTVIAGKNPGFILTDNTENPETAIVFHQGEAGFYFLGNPDNDNFNSKILPYIKDILKKKLSALNIDSFEFSGDCTLWNIQFEKLFKKTNMWVSKQRIYISENSNIDIHVNKSTDYQIYKIKPELINDKSIVNPGFISDEVNEFWKDWNTFAIEGGGFYAKNNKEIIGKCVADGIANNMIAVRIEVSESYRRKGIAIDLASEFVKWAGTKEKHIYWECADDNTGSIKLAEKLGLQLHQIYNLYGFTV